MSDWIDEYAASLESNQDEKGRRAQKAAEIEHQLASFWNDLQYMLQGTVRKINANEKIVKEIGHKLEYSELNIFSIKIEKRSFPSIILLVSRGQGMIEAKREIGELELDEQGYGNINNVTRREESEKLHCLLDGEVLQFRTEDQRVLSGADLPQYLLAPLLIPSTPQRRGFRY